MEREPFDYRFNSHFEVNIGALPTAAPKWAGFLEYPSAPLALLYTTIDTHICWCMLREAQDRRIYLLCSSDLRRKKQEEGEENKKGGGRSQMRNTGGFITVWTKQTGL